MDRAILVFEDATVAGREITPPALAIAIRSALIHCRDDRGQLSVAKLYDLTSDLENLTI